MAARGVMNSSKLVNLRAAMSTRRLSAPKGLGLDPIGFRAINKIAVRDEGMLGSLLRSDRNGSLRPCLSVIFSSREPGLLI